MLHEVFHSLDKALSEGVSCYKEMWGQERVYSVNRNKDRIFLEQFHNSVVPYFIQHRDSILCEVTGNP